MRQHKLEILLWSIALPGFGQLLNRSYYKGTLFVILEVLINHMSRLNRTIQLSFQGDIEGALAVTDFQWLLFYPCVYMFAMWDAYKDAGGGQSTPYTALLFVLPAFMATVGIIYSDKMRLFGTLIGPVWLPMLFCFIGLLIAYVICKLFTRDS